MNKNRYLVFAYHLILLLESMILVTAIDGYKTPLFTATLHFNLLYLPIGGILNYLALILLQSFTNNKLLLLTTHAIAVILLFNTIIYFTEHQWLFQDKWTAILAHLLIADCYILALLLTRKTIQQGTTNP